MTPLSLLIRRRDRVLREKLSPVAEHPLEPISAVETIDIESGENLQKLSKSKSLSNAIKESSMAADFVSEDAPTSEV